MKKKDTIEAVALPPGWKQYTAPIPEHLLRKKGEPFKLTRPVSNNQLNYFEISPKHWLHYILKERTPSTPAQIQGSVTHALAFEPDQVEKEFYVFDKSQMPYPASTLTKRENKAWKEDQLQLADGRDLVTPEQLLKAQRMLNEVWDHPRARELMEAKGKYEKEKNWQYSGVKCMGKLDKVTPAFIMDLKTVRDASPRKFQRTLFNEGTYRQGGMYLDGDMGGVYVGDNSKEFYYIAVENEEPHAVSVHRLTPEVIAFGLGRYRHFVDGLKTCLEFNDFPGYDFHLIENEFDVDMPYFTPGE